MKRTTKTLFGFIATAPLLTAGCSLLPPDETPINTRQDFIQLYKFSPFVPPRAGDGAGSVISFNESGEESLIYSADNCLSPESVPLGEPLPVAIENREYEIDADSNYEWNLGKVFAPNFDLSGALKTDRVAKVKFRLIEPSMVRIEKGVAEEFVKGLSEETGCRNQLSRDENLVVHTVLIAQGIEYSFANARDVDVEVDATILTSIGLTADHNSNIQDRAGLVLGKPMFYGYRAWLGRELSGLAVDRFRFDDLQPQEVETLRNPGSAR